MLLFEDFNSDSWGKNYKIICLGIGDICRGEHSSIVINGEENSLMYVVQFWVLQAFFEMPILRNDFILNSVSYEDKRFYDKTFYELVKSKSSIAS